MKVFDEVAASDASAYEAVSVYVRGADELAVSVSVSYDYAECAMCGVGDAVYDGVASVGEVAGDGGSVYAWVVDDRYV